jgi:hypothetical protein
VLSISHIGNLATHLNKVLALRLRDKRLKLGSGESVHQTSLGND